MELAIFHVSGQMEQSTKYNSARREQQAFTRNGRGLTRHGNQGDAAKDDFLSLVAISRVLLDFAPLRSDSPLPYKGKTPEKQARFSNVHAFIYVGLSVSFQRHQPLP